MNQTSQYIFNLYHYLLNIRDTMEYIIDRPHDAKMFEQRKTILTKGIQTGTALGNFLDNNKEQGEKIREKLNEYIDEIYGEDSTLLSIHEGQVRVDHTQHLKIYDGVVGLTESIRDIIFGYINHARQKGDLEDEILKLMILDDVFYRTLFFSLVIRDFEKSFIEFQKVFGEAGGKPTPQSNYIVTNELQKMAGMMRFCRAHTHCTDNKTLDLLDKTIQLLEMTEGRRDRRDNKSFKDLFQEVHTALGEHLKESEVNLRKVSDKLFQEMIALAKVRAHEGNNEA